MNKVLLLIFVHALLGLAAGRNGQRSLLDGKYTMKYTVKESTIAFDVNVEASGWAGIGLSTVNETPMKKSDLLIVHPTETGHDYTVCEATEGETAPVCDKAKNPMNWQVTDFHEHEGSMHFVVERSLTYEVNEGDLYVPVEDKTMYYLASYSNDPITDPIDQHTQAARININFYHEAENSATYNNVSGILALTLTLLLSLLNLFFF